MTQPKASGGIRFEGGAFQSSPRKTSGPDQPLVTIVTVVLNKRTQLEKTVASVGQQNYENLEHIVIDGGSSDGTVELLRERDQSIDHWISEPDTGISAAFNKGLALANGDIVAFLNAGDWYERDAIETVCSVFRHHPEADVACGAIRLWNPDSSSLVCLSNPSLIEKETSVYHPAVFVKKSSYEKFGYFDENYRYAMDYELLLRFHRRGAKLINLESVIANMSLDGISYEHWYSGLKEVKKARSEYFPRHDVLIRHWLAVLKNLVARGLKLAGLSDVYRFYWYKRNERTMKQPMADA